MNYIQYGQPMIINECSKSDLRLNENGLQVTGRGHWVSHTGTAIAI